MSEQSPPWTLIIPSDLRLLGLARTFVETMCRFADLDRAATDETVLATHEAINNIIRHAHQDHPDAQLQIQCRPVSDGIEINLLDEGAPFDLGAVPHLNPGELRIGGRGVFLMRTLMDELTCEPRGERGNALRMVKRRCRDSAPCADS
jgi:serine/threonine-protein kinase RsbW